MKTSLNYNLKLLSQIIHQSIIKYIKTMSNYNLEMIQKIKCLCSNSLEIKNYKMLIVIYYRMILAMLQ